MPRPKLTEEQKLARLEFALANQARRYKICRIDTHMWARIGNYEPLAYDGEDYTPLYVVRTDKCVRCEAKRELTFTPYWDEFTKRPLWRRVGRPLYDYDPAYKLPSAPSGVSAKQLIQAEEFGVAMKEYVQAFSATYRKDGNAQSS